MIETNLDEYTPSPEDYAAIYARKSIPTDNNSIENQISLGKEALFKNNLVLYKVYSEEISAVKYSSSERNAFSQLKNDALQGKFKTVIVFKRDRLARKVDDFLDIKNFFKKLNINIIYSNPSELPSYNNPMSNLLENILLAIAEFEPTIIAERTSLGREKKRKNRLYGYGFPPFGYARNDNTFPKEFFPKDENNEAEIVRLIFNKYTDKNENYNTISSLMKVIDETGLLNKPCNYRFVSRIIENPIYAGLQLINTKINVNDTIEFDSTSNKAVINENSYQECTNVINIIEPSKWYEAIQKYRTNTPYKKHPKVTYLFKEILYCSNCGKKIYLKGNRYRCRTNSCTSIEKNIVIDSILNYLIDDLLTKDKVNAYTSKATSIINTDIQNIRDKLSKIKKQQETNITKLINYPNDTIYIDKLTLLNKKEENLINSLEQKKKSFENISNLKTSLEKIIENTSTKKQLLCYLKKDINKLQISLQKYIKKVSINEERTKCSINNVEY